MVKSIVLYFLLHLFTIQAFSVRRFSSKVLTKMSMSNVELFGSQGSRSPLINWYLHEINCDFKMAERSSVNPHPFGQIPCLKDGNVVMFESGAILMYLADKYGGLDSPEKRAAVSAWVVFANASLDPILFKENERGQVIGTGAAEENKKLNILNDILFKSGDNYILGEEFSVADVAIASYLLYVPLFFGKNVNMGRWPSLSKYMLKNAQRDAYRKAYPTETDKIIEACKSYK